MRKTKVMYHRLQRVNGHEVLVNEYIVTWCTTSALKCFFFVNSKMCQNFAVFTNLRGSMWIEHEFGPFRMNDRRVNLKFHNIKTMKIL